MMLITAEQREQLLANGKVNRQRRDAGKDEEDFRPVIKLFSPDGAATWLLTEIDPKEPDIAFGLCDLGFGSPELGYVSLSEIASVRGRRGLPIERDRYFEASKTLEAYAKQARQACRIIA